MIYYSADNIWIIGRRQDKKGTEVQGYHFVIRIEKSRFLREKSAIPITVSFEGGIEKWSGLLDVALELGYAKKPKNGWYCAVDPSKEEGEDGYALSKNVRAADTLKGEFWKPVFEQTDFSDAIINRFKISNSEMVSEGEDDEIKLSRIYHKEKSNGADYVEEAEV